MQIVSSFGDNLQKNVKPYFLSKIISSEIFPAC